MWFLAWTAAVAQASCDETEQLLDAADAAVLEARVGDALTALEKLPAAMSGCERASTPEQLARMWNIEGVALAMRGEKAAAAQAFAASARVSPDTWDDNYGAALKDQRDAASARSAGEATLVLVPAPVDNIAHLDGTRATFPATVAAGVHLVQVGPEDRPSQFVRIVSIEAYETTEIATGLAEAAPEPVAASRQAKEPRARADKGGGGAGTPVIIAGAGLLVVGAGSAALALAQSGSMKDATTVDALDAAYDRQKIFGTTAYVLLGAGAVGVGVGFAL